MAGGWPPAGSRPASGTSRPRLYVHHSGDSNGGTMRAALHPRDDMPDVDFAEDARLIYAFLCDELPARTMAALEALMKRAS